MNKLLSTTWPNCSRTFLSFPNSSTGYIVQSQQNHPILKQKRSDGLSIKKHSVISTFNSLTLSPALAALLLKPHDAPKPKFLLARAALWAGERFNKGFDRVSGGYAGGVRLLVGRKVMRLGMLLIFAGLIFGTVQAVDSVPRGFIPQQDQGYAIVVVQLPDAASLNTAPTRWCCGRRRSCARRPACSTQLVSPVFPAPPLPMPRTPA